MLGKESLYEAVHRSVRGMSWSIALFSAGVNLLILVTAIYMLQVYDRVLSSGSIDTLIWLSVIAVLAIIAYGFLEFARRLMLSRAAFWVDRELTSTVLVRHMRARLAGEPPAAGPRQVSDLRNYYKSDAPLALHDAPWSLFFIGFIWLLHPILGAFALGGAAILVALALINDAATRSRQDRVSGEVREVNEAALRYLDSGETIQPLGMTDALFGRWRGRQIAARLNEQSLTERTTAIMNVSRSLRLGLQMGILGIGAFLVLQGQITAGAMIAASIILGRALAPIERVTGAWRRMLAARSARVALASCFDTIEDRQPSRKVELPRPLGDMSVEHVWFTPEGSEKPALKDISFDLPRGKTLVVVGPSGAGKSSLCRLLTGAWQPASGHVRLDGADVFDWAKNDLGRHVGYLPQKVELFPGTVAENIARFQEATSEEIVAAAMQAGVHELILSLPTGYDTVIDDSTSQIPLGQRQRIGLARAMFKNPALVVLDEPNSNLDRSGDLCLQEALKTLKARGCSIVVVTHRAQVLKHADLALALREGQIEKFGKPEQKVKPVATQSPVAGSGDEHSIGPKSTRG